MAEPFKSDLPIFFIWFKTVFELFTPQFKFSDFSEFIWKVFSNYSLIVESYNSNFSILFEKKIKSFRTRSSGFWLFQFFRFYMKNIFGIIMPGWTHQFRFSDFSDFIWKKNLWIICALLNPLLIIFSGSNRKVF